MLVSFLGIIILQEQYLPRNYLGLFLIFISTIILVIDKKQKIKLSQGMIFALLAAVTSSLCGVMDKTVMGHFAPFTYAFVNSLLVGLVFMGRKKTRQDAFKIIRKHRWYLLLPSISNISAFILILTVVKSSDISQCLPVYKGLSFVIPVIFGIVALKETDKLKKKIIAVVLSLVGIMLLY